MGGKGGGDSPMMQEPTSTIDTKPAALDLSKDQQFIDAQRAARDATAPAGQPTAAPPAQSLGDTAALTVQAPDYWNNKGLLTPTPIKRSSMAVTGGADTGTSKAAGTTTGPV